MANKSMNLPFRSGTKGMFETTQSYMDLIRLKLKVLFSTEENSRIMELDYGAGLKQFLFEPNDDFTGSRIKSFILRKMNTYMPELNTTENDIDVTWDEHTINIDLRILINGTRQTIKMKIEK
jgi:phage baseplate assembly protein W